MDEDIFALPDGYEDEDYILATYFIKTESSENIIEKTKAIAIEQTTSTWTSVPGETPDLRKRYLGKVVSICETPDYELEINKDVGTRQFIFQIAYPVENIGPTLPPLINDHFRRDIFHKKSEVG